MGGRELAGRPVRDALPEIAAQGFVDLLDRVDASGERHVGRGTTVKLQRAAGEPQEERIVDFVHDRLRATFASQLVLQGFLDADGNLLDANPAALEAIGRSLEEVGGRPFRETPWFEGAPEVAQQLRDAVAVARRGEVVRRRRRLRLTLPAGPREFDFSLRPAFHARGEGIGLVPEAVQVAAP